jgi:hypothetical protein
MAQPGFIEGPWSRFEYAFTTSVPAGTTLTSGPNFNLIINQEDVVRFAGGGISLGAGDSSGSLQLAAQQVFIEMRSAYPFLLPIYPPTQLNFPQDTDPHSAQLILTFPPIEIPGEALGSGGWPTLYLGVRYSIRNTDSTNAHSFTARFSLPYQIISRRRAV